MRYGRRELGFDVTFLGCLEISCCYVCDDQKRVR